MVLSLYFYYFNDRQFESKFIKIHVQSIQHIILDKYGFRCIIAPLPKSINTNLKPFFPYFNHLYRKDIS